MSTKPIVHFTWNERLNDHYPQVLEYRNRWQIAGFQVRVTPNADIRNDVVTLEKALHRSDMIPKFDSLETDNMRYDYWRYTKLYLEGGVYSDVDVLPGLALHDWVKKSASTNHPVFFEGSNWPHNGFFRFFVPLVSDYQSLPSMDTCLVISATPGSKALIALLDAMDPGKWANAPEPRKTLMAVGPGIVSEFTRSRPDVIKVYFWDRKRAYKHVGFGTWKSGVPREYNYLIQSTFLLLLLAMMILLARYFNKMARRFGLNGLIRKEKVEEVSSTNVEPNPLNIKTLLVWSV